MLTSAHEYFLFILYFPFSFYVSEHYTSTILIPQEFFLKYNLMLMLVMVMLTVFFKMFNLGKEGNLQRFPRASLVVCHRCMFSGVSFG